MPFIKTFAVAGLVPVIILLAIGFFIQPLEGDLTRLGNLSERSWGWNKPRLVIDQQDNEDSPNSNVIVIGDSFSVSDLWQSVAQRASGLSFVSYHWNVLGSPACLSEAISVLLKQHPAARTVVIQSIERHFVSRFSDWSIAQDQCPKEVKPNQRVVEQLPPLRKSSFDLSGGLPDALYAVKALAAERKTFTQPEMRGQVGVAPLSRSDLFSNRRSGWLLYLAEDLDKRQWTGAQMAQAMVNIKTLTAQLEARGVQPLFLIIPDKLTVYSPYLRKTLLTSAPPDIWNELKKADVPSVPLNEIFAREVTKRVDLYLPDDTHTGNEAWAIMGEQVGAFLRGEVR